MGMSLESIGLNDGLYTGDPGLSMRALPVVEVHPEPPQRT